MSAVFLGAKAIRRHFSFDIGSFDAEAPFVQSNGCCLEVQMVLRLLMFANPQRTMAGFVSGFQVAPLFAVSVRLVSWDQRIQLKAKFPARFVT